MPSLLRDLLKIRAELRRVINIDFPPGTFLIILPGSSLSHLQPLGVVVQKYCFLANDLYFDCNLRQ
jgi:hypothetical protein